jgi:hypothetical protein
MDDRSALDLIMIEVVMPSRHSSPDIADGGESGGEDRVNSEFDIQQKTVTDKPYYAL